MLERRLHVLLDGERYERLAAEARTRGVSVAAVVREAIDRALPATSAARRTAARHILAGERVGLPGPEEIRAELEDLRARRG